MTRGIPLILIAATLVGIAACNVLPVEAPVPQLHDFGPPPISDNAGPALPLQVGQVTATESLSDNAIHYRLLHNDPTMFRSYADNRWVSSPAELLDTGLTYALPPTSGNGSGDTYTLDGQLLEFEQDISTSNDAKVRLVLQVSIRRTSDGQIIAERRFEMEQASTADIQGAVTRLSQLAQKTEQAVAAWAKERVSHP
jgi:cholesterol transport system auxiliary component